jgi:hypothetical protein
MRAYSTNVMGRREKLLFSTIKICTTLSPGKTEIRIEKCIS